MRSNVFRLNFRLCIRPHLLIPSRLLLSSIPCLPITLPAPAPGCCPSCFRRTSSDSITHWLREREWTLDSRLEEFRPTLNSCASSSRFLNLSMPQCPHLFSYRVVLRPSWCTQTHYNNAWEVTNAGQRLVSVSIIIMLPSTTQPHIFPWPKKPFSAQIPPTFPLKT